MSSLADDAEASASSSGWKVAGLDVPLIVIGRGLRWIGRRSLAGRLVMASWVSWFAIVGVLYLEYWLGVLHPSGWLLVGLLALAILATIGSQVVGTRQLWKGPTRRGGLTISLLGLVPPVIVATLLLMGVSQFRRGHIEARLPFILLAMAGTSLGELAVDWTYPHRIETQTLIMSYGDGLSDPEGDVAAMEMHIRRLHYMTHRGPRGKLHWVRGPVFGQRYLSIAGVALGSDQSPLSTVDYHEAGHEAVYQLLTPESDPAMIFAEGWAEAVSHNPEELARGALQARDELVSLASVSGEDWERLRGRFSDPDGMSQMRQRMIADGPDGLSVLRELNGPFWYHRDRGLVYPIGGAFADFVIRRYSPEQFVSLILGVQPGNLDLMCQRIFQATPETIEAAFWRDMEQVAGGR